MPSQTPDHERVAAEAGERFSLLARERGPGAVDALRRQFCPDEELLYGGLARLRTGARAISGLRGGRVGVVAVTSHRLMWCSPHGKPQQLAGEAPDTPVEQPSDQDERGAAEDRAPLESAPSTEWSLRDLERGRLDALLADWRGAHGALADGPADETGGAVPAKPAPDPTSQPTHGTAPRLALDQGEGDGAPDAPERHPPDTGENSTVAALPDTGVTACRMCPIGYVTLTDGLTLPARIDDEGAPAGEVVHIERHQGDLLLARRVTAGSRS